MGKAAERIAIGRALIAKQLPYFRGLLATINASACEHTPTLSMDARGRMRYNPAFIETIPERTVAGCIAHEFFHLLLKHVQRGRLREKPHVFNIAGDLAINPIVRGLGFTLPEGVLWPSDKGFPEGLSADEYYELLLKKEELGSAGRDGEPSIAAGQCGSCSHGHSEEGDSSEGDSSEGDSSEGDSSDEVSTGAGAGDELANPFEKFSREGAVTAAVRNAAEGALAHSRTRGLLPHGSLLDLHSWSPRPKVDWRRTLSFEVRNLVSVRLGGQDASYAYINRRQAGVGVGVGSPRLSSLVDITPEVVVAIDTSGSMTQQAHAAALGELNGVLRALNLSVTLVTCDARVHEAREVRNLRDALPLMKGGGGTDFDPIFAHVAKMKQRPDLLVVLTDGICPSPTVSLPGVRVLWVIIGTRNELKPGRNIFIPSNEEQ